MWEVESLRQNLGSQKLERAQLLAFQDTHWEPGGLQIPNQKKGKPKSRRPQMGLAPIESQQSGLKSWESNESVTCCTQRFRHSSTKVLWRTQHFWISQVDRNTHLTGLCLLLPGFHGDKHSGLYPQNFKVGVLFLFSSERLLVSTAFCMDWQGYPNCFHKTVIGSCYIISSLLMYAYQLWPHVQLKYFAGRMVPAVDPRPRSLPSLFINIRKSFHLLRLFNKGSIRSPEPKVFSPHGYLCVLEKSLLRLCTCIFSLFHFSKTQRFQCGGQEEGMKRKPPFLARLHL